MLGEVDVQRGPGKERGAKRGNELKRVKRRHLRLGPTVAKVCFQFGKTIIQVTKTRKHKVAVTAILWFKSQPYLRTL